MKPFVSEVRQSRVTLATSVPLSLLMAVVLFTACQLRAETLRGQVRNGTSHGSVVPGITVTLQAFDSKDRAVKEAETRTDAKGQFSLQTNAALKVDYRQVSASYQGVSFESEPMRLDARHPSEPVTVMVYDTTTDAKNLLVAMHHVMIAPKKKDPGSDSAELWEIREVLAFHNMGKQAFVGSQAGGSGKRRTVRFSLPKGYRNFEAEEGLIDAAAGKTADAVYDTTIVPPGEKTYRYSYDLPANTLRRGWRRAVDYATYQEAVMGMGDDIELSSAQLPHRESQSMGDKTMSYIMGRNLKPGTEVVVKIQSPELPGRNAPMLIGVAAGLLLITGIVTLTLRPKRAAVGAKGKKMATSRDAILDQIADLDDQKEAGKIGEADYQKRRAKLKSLLAKR